MNRTFRISRYKPATVDLPLFQELILDIADEDSTVLEALDHIRHQRDRGLMYRRSCHHGSCGTCALRVNGIERLACITKLRDLSDPMILEPLSGFRPLGDLVVDTSPLYRHLDPSWPILRKSERATNTLRLEDCIECGSCVSACPAVGEDSLFIGPAALAALNRQLENDPEEKEALLEIAGSEGGARLCQRAIDCSRRCPTGVSPARHIAELLSG